MSASPAPRNGLEAPPAEALLETLQRLVPSILDAPLPASYSAARQAIAQCHKIDECKDWADKAAAMASYARQANDEALENFARRIRVRALERSGELLRQLTPRRGANQNIGDGADPNVLTRKQAATDAGLSERQRKTALRLANIPTDEFEAAVESDHPPSVDELAECGTRKKPLFDLGSRTPDEFKQAGRLIGLFDQFHREAQQIHLDLAFRGLNERERRQVIETAGNCLEWTKAMLERISHV